VALLAPFGGGMAQALSAVSTYTACGLVYEFSHFISHTRVKLPSMLEKLRRHHMNHHLVSSQHWLAFTLPAIDGLMGTLPPRNDPKAIPELERNHHCRHRKPLAASAGEEATSKQP
jgi:hypothetical protein